MSERTSESLAASLAGRSADRSPGASEIVRCLLACGPGGVAAIAAAASAGLAPRAGEIIGRDFEAGTFGVLLACSLAPVGSSMSLLGASVAPLLGLLLALAGSCAGATRPDFSASRALGDVKVRLAPYSAALGEVHGAESQSVCVERLRALLSDARFYALVWARNAS